MFNFIKYFNIYNFLIIGTQNVISKNNSLLFNNSGFSSIKKLLINNNNNIVSYQYCIRLKGIFNDLKYNNDGIHQTSFLMLGVFKKNKNLFKLLFLSLNYIYYIKKIKKNKIFFTVNKNDYFNIIILLLCKINVKKIIFTKKNIWKINKKGYLGFCIEIYILKNKNLIEIWNFVDIKFIKFNKIIKLKNNIIDSGLGYNRICNFKIYNLRLNDICNTIYLIINNICLNFTKNHIFILNKLIKIIIKIILIKKISIFKIFILFFLIKKKFFFKNNIFYFLNYIIKKEFFFLLNIKKINIKKINIKTLKNMNETFGIPYNYIYKIIKNIYK
ncbi:alanine--tRNA ligase-related protein [Candidatus Carsonella ruddii]|uniref:Alanine--tRNA ligase n=1 Tax=Candidatus Carsonella ruddii HC isolate Thao2000 TaxID=1202538 RepID=J3VPX9_CARRU|nr:alanine--tRNA ligase-related protein [Candidatus Carsonella ruddii]AFP83976.1 putative alanyl-tRNA synthetase [Candidatus Carsonella ruddii HC isolate Thao2000]